MKTTWKRKYYISVSDTAWLVISRDSMCILHTVLAGPKFRNYIVTNRNLIKSTYCSKWRCYTDIHLWMKNIDSKQAFNIFFFQFLCRNQTHMVLLQRLWPEIYEKKKIIWLWKDSILKNINGGLYIGRGEETIYFNFQVIFNNIHTNTVLSACMKNSQNLKKHMKTCHAYVSWF